MPVRLELLFRRYFIYMCVAVHARAVEINERAPPARPLPICQLDGPNIFDPIAAIGGNPFAVLPKSIGSLELIGGFCTQVLHAVSFQLVQWKLPGYFGRNSWVNSCKYFSRFSTTASGTA